jgi:hypothetical protein
MKTSRERTLLITVLGVAGLGLLIDRVIIGSDVTGPAQTSAGVIDSIDAGLAQPAGVLPEVSGESPVEVISFAQRLRSAVGSSVDTDPAACRDAFSPGTGWDVGGLGVGPATDNKIRELAQAFQGGHTLEAVLVSGDKRYAVVDGQTLYIGQELDGYRLAEVHERTAIFQARGIRVEIGIKAGAARR